MIDPRGWTVAILVGVAIGAVMAALDAPEWSYPVVLAAVVATGLWVQRRNAE